MEQRGKHVRVLIVDDNHAVVETVSMALRLLGFDVRGAYDGLAALEAAIEFRPNVVLIDLALPLIDGWELAAQLRRLSVFRCVRLVALTGLAAAVYRDPSIAAGFDDYLQKPATVDAIQSALLG
jgi:CheY-like chemotaxis protein